jgi:hypothetical protein
MQWVRFVRDTVRRGGDPDRGEAVPFDEHAAEAEMDRRGQTYIAQTCHVCGTGEDSRVLLPCRRDGASLWVCTRCLPALIHE